MKYSTPTGIVWSERFQETDTTIRVICTCVITEESEGDTMTALRNALATFALFIATLAAHAYCALAEIDTSSPITIQIGKE